MNDIQANPGSFRDPSGRIYHIGDRVFRSVTDYAAEEYEFVRDSKLIDRLAADGMVVPGEPVSCDILGPDGGNARYVIEHPRLPFIAYPYEWPFPALRAAALLHLDIHLAALKDGVTLSDASAYNIQFQGAEPVFIDILSFRRYREGEIWAGHRQFCEQFLNPLLLQSALGIAHNSWYRGALEGIGTSDLNALLPWFRKLSPNVLTHVVLQSALQKSAQKTTREKSKNALKGAALPRAAFEKMLVRLRGWIDSLAPAGGDKTVWQDYANSHSYAGEEAAAKRRFIAEFTAAAKPALLWDLGCNTGDYSAVALENGAGYVVGFDFDQGALNAGFARAKSGKLKFQPLFFDGANPVSGQGWAEAERMGFKARATGDAILALALVHHLAIGRNVPLPYVLDWLVGLAPQGVIEFVPKADPMVQELLSLREDIFFDYSEDAFTGHLNKIAKVVKSETVTATGRTLFWYRRADRG